MSLQELVNKHGFGIKVTSNKLGWPDFLIVKEDGDCYAVMYINGQSGRVLKDCSSTNDYELVK